jgi:hypothetical protein
VRLAAALAVLAAAAAPAPFVVQADRSVGGLAVGRGTLAQATARFGKPTSRTPKGANCTAVWKPLGLRISFLDFVGNACATGGAVQLTITDPKHWRTGRGLRVGDAAARVQQLYPAAKLHPGDGWWLVPRHACKETGGAAYPGLLARVHMGQVTALVVTAGVCE